MTDFLGELPSLRSNNNKAPASSNGFQRLDVIDPKATHHRHSVLVAGPPSVDNPFSNTTWTTRPWWWRVVEVICFFTLFPLRIVVLLALASVVVLPALLILRLCRCFDGAPVDRPPDPVEDFAIPHSKLRRMALLPSRWFARVLLWCAGIWWITYIERPGCARSSSDIKVLVANHCAFLDAVWAFFWAAPMVVAKEELVTFPIVSSVIIAIQGIFVKRNDPLDKKKVIMAIKKRTTTPGFPPLLVFPEGTCTNGKMLIQWKKGAFVGGTPVQAVRIQYVCPYVNPAAVGDFDSIVCLWRLMFQPFVSMRVTLLPLYHPSEEEKKDADKFAAGVRASLAKEMGCKMTEHSYDDMYLRFFAAKEQIPLNQNFEVTMMQSMFKLDFEGLKALLLRFSELDAAKKGYLTIDQICQAMKVSKDDAEAQTIFNFFDNDGSGLIDFAAFVRGISLLSDKLEDVDRLRLAFDILDRDSTGRVKLSDLNVFLDEAIDVRRRLSQISDDGKAPQQETDLEKQSKIMAELKQEQQHSIDIEKQVKHELKQDVPAGSRPSEQDLQPGRLVRTMSLVECFEAMDTDKDGAMNYEEFLKFVQARKGLDTHIIQSVKTLTSKLHTV